MFLIKQVSWIVEEDKYRRGRGGGERKKKKVRS